MRISFPKNDSATHWTSHVKRKMLFYGLSEQRIRSVMRSPKRQEEGIAPKTVAAMQRNDKPKRKEEVWVMYAKVKRQTVVISAWRYPGMSKARDGVPMPDDAALELEKFLNVI